MSWILWRLLVFGFTLFLSTCHCYSSLQSKPCQLHNQRNESSEMFLTTSSLNHVASIHENITLSCEFVNYCFITWHRNRDMITEGSRYHLLSEDLELNIQNVTMEDTGTYTCMAFNGTHNISMQGVVTVLAQPTEAPKIFTYSRLSYTTQVGRSFTLECRTDALVTLKWYHNGSEITTSSSHQFLENRQVLKVQDPSVSDAGEYMCSALLGSHNFSRKGLVTISNCDTADVVLKGCQPGLTIAAKIGSNVSVSCTFDIGAGHITMTATWFVLNSTSGENMFVRSTTFSGGALVKTHNYQQGHRDKTCSNRRFYVLTLNITNVTEEVYDTFYGFVKIGAAYEFANVTVKPVKEEFFTIKSSAVFYLVIFFTASFFLSLAVWKKFHLDIKLMYKHRLGGLKVHKHLQQDGKLYDTYIACSDNNKDIGFVINVLIPALSEKGYSVCFREIDFEPGAGTHDEMWRCMKSSRSCVLLLTPEFFQENFGLNELQAATDTFSDQTKSIIPILREDVPEFNVKANPVLKYLAANNSLLKLKSDCFISKKKLVSSDVFKSTRLVLPHPSQRRQDRFGRKKKPSLVEQEVKPSEYPKSSVSSEPATSNNNFELLPV